MPKLPKEFMKPSLALLPRVADQLSFLYVDIARIVKEWTELTSESPSVAMPDANLDNLESASNLSGTT